MIRSWKTFSTMDISALSASQVSNPSCMTASCFRSVKYLFLPYDPHFQVTNLLQIAISNEAIKNKFHDPVSC